MNNIGFVKLLKARHEELIVWTKADAALCTKLLWIPTNGKKKKGEKTSIHVRVTIKTRSSEQSGSQVGANHYTMPTSPLIDQNWENWQGGILFLFFSLYRKSTNLSFSLPSPSQWRVISLSKIARLPWFEGESW